MSKSTRKQIQDNVQYPDLSLVSYGTQPATEPANVFKSGPDTTHAAEKVEETKQKIARVKKSAARKAEDQQDEEDRAKLLREGALNAQHYARTSPVPDAIKAYYSKMPVIQSFQKLWANPQVPDPKALKSLERYNDIMEEEIEAYVPQDDSRTRPERWYISQWKLPIQEFLTFAVGAKKVIAARKGGSDEQAFQKAGIDAAMASEFVTKNLPLFHIRMRQIGIPWQAYIAEDMMFLFKELSKGEHQARNDLVADFIKGDEEHFLQQLDRQDKQLIGIPTTSADNPQSESKKVDDGSAKPGYKKRLTETRANAIATQNEDAPMWVAEGRDESAVDNTSTPKTTEKSESVDSPNSAIAAPAAKAVEPNLNDSKPAESTPANKAQSQNPEPEIGLLEFSMEVNDDGRTHLGQVVHIIKIGERGSRVIVNEGTERFPSFAIYPGAAFFGVAREWIEKGCFGSDSDMDQMKITKITALTSFVDVARVVEAPKRNQRQIRIYRVRLADGAIGWITRVHIVKMVGGPANWRNVYAKKERCLEKFQDDRRKKLDEDKQNHRHPDTSAPLTKDDLARMPWLMADEGEGDGDNGDQKNQQHTPTVNQQDGQKNQEDTSAVSQQDGQKDQQDGQKDQQDTLAVSQQDGQKNQQDTLAISQQESQKGLQDTLAANQQNGPVSQEMRGEVVWKGEHQNRQKRRHE